MTAGHAVTPSDAVRWLHDDGLRRLAGLGNELPDTAAAYTVRVSNGDITSYPVNGGGGVTLGAEDLPTPAETSGRLIVVGVIASGALLVIDLAAALTISVNGAEPDGVLRAWAAQLLLNHHITLTTNSTGLGIGSPRFRHVFIPGSAVTILTIDDGYPPVTTVCVNPSDEGHDRLDLTGDNTGRLSFGSRFWLLWRTMSIGTAAWNELLAHRVPASTDPIPEEEQ